MFPGPPCDAWTVGWLTGRDSDLICAKPNVTDSYEGELALSPTGSSPLLAILGFVAKCTLLTIDGNLLSLLEWNRRERDIGD